MFFKKIKKEIRELRSNYLDLEYYRKEQSKDIKKLLFIVSLFMKDNNYIETDCWNGFPEGTKEEDFELMKEWNDTGTKIWKKRKKNEKSK